MKKMSYTFVCIGTNKIISDSFGPRVGNKLKKVFYLSPEINVYGTMKNPIHLKNAMLFLDEIKNEKQIILYCLNLGAKVGWFSTRDKYNFIKY